MSAEHPALRDLAHILESVRVGVYVVNRNREIVFWNGAAQAITGWTADAVIGTACHDSLLCHVDKDGQELCGEDTCPLLRAMVTGEASRDPVMVLAKTADGERVPVEVSVAPVRDDQGSIVGGVETFVDVRERYEDLLRAQRMQLASCTRSLKLAGPLSFEALFSPHDLVGGDYLYAQALAHGGCAVFVADVMGHGIAAGLHTAYLHGLCSEFSAIIDRPAEFLGRLNDRLCELLKVSESFATALTAVFEPASGTMRVASAGGPPPLLMSADGGVAPVTCGGLPLGMMLSDSPEVVEHPMEPGDVVVLCTDGLSEAVERNGSGDLAQVLADLGYPAAEPGLPEVHRRVLERSGEIRLPDDTTLVEVRYRR